MSLLNWFRKKEVTTSTPSPMDRNNQIHSQTTAPSGSTSHSKEDFFRMILEQQMQRTVSDHFVSGAVFDLSRQNRAVFLEVLNSNNATALKNLFGQIFSLFLEHPEYVGFTPQMVDKNKNDTNPFTWNTDIFVLPNGEKAALLFMPVQNETLSARIVGIIFSDKGDGYYYCMLNKDANIPSVVKRNRAMLGIKEIDEIRGLGFELMHSFLTCISNDFLNS